MEFKDLLQKYKDGTASVEERAAVEAELDRARLIEEYLAEEFAPADDFAPVDTGEFDRVKKSIKRRTRRIIMAAVSVAVVLAILAVSVLQPAIVGWLNSRYLDPNAAEYSEFLTDFDLSFTAYTELHHPGYIYAGSVVKNTGIGEYEISVRRHDHAMELEFMTMYLDKGEMTLPSEFHFSEPAANIIAKASYPEYHHFSTPEQVALTREKLESLPDYITVTAAVSFDEDITMAQLCDFMEGTDVWFRWAGIRNSPKDVQRYPLCGMELSGSGWVMDFVNDDYANFEMSGAGREPEDFEQHFKSLIAYLRDNPEYIQSFMTEQSFDYYYDSVAEYIEENGVMCYGGVVQGTGAQLLELMDMDNVIQLHIMEADLSV